jgi:hypothetical protein
MTKTPQLQKLYEEKDKTKVVDQYIQALNDNELLVRTNSDLTAEIGHLKDRIAELEKRPKKPNIPPPKSNDSSSRGKICKNAEKRNKKKSDNSNKLKPKTHDTKLIPLKNVPDGARFKGYKDYFVQNVILSANNILYRRAWYEKDGKNYIAKLPDSVKGHYGSDLIAYILNEHYTKRVTEGLIHESLNDMGTVISSAQISNIISGKVDDFEDDYNDVLQTGLYFSRYIQTDDTGAKHNTKRGYCTVIANEAFAWYKSTDSKSRINFLTQLNEAGFNSLIFNESAAEYLSRYKIVCNEVTGQTFSTSDELKIYLDKLSIKGKKARKVIEEAGLFGSVNEFLDFRNIFLMSDNAGQFNIFFHIQCWVHAERNVKKLDIVNKEFIEEKNFVLDCLWQCYFNIDLYKTSHNGEFRDKAMTAFKNLTSLDIKHEALKKQVRFIRDNKDQFLAALIDPALPIHNNLSENDVRQYVMKRQISGATKSENGKKSRDVFISLKITCRKCGVKFIDYLKDRLGKIGEIPEISQLIKNKIIQLGIADPLITGIKT